MTLLHSSHPTIHPFDQHSSTLLTPKQIYRFMYVLIVNIRLHLCILQCIVLLLLYITLNCIALHCDYDYDCLVQLCLCGELNEKVYATGCVCCIVLCCVVLCCVVCVAYVCLFFYFIYSII